MPWIVVVGLAGLLFLTGCAPFVDTPQPRIDGPVLTGSLIGQTLVAHHDGLSAVEVALGPVSQPVTMTLWTEPEGQALATSRVQPSAALWVRFPFSPLPASHSRRYFAELSAPAPLTVTSGLGDAYHDGVIYIDGRPQDAQLPFRLGYEPGLLILGLLSWLASGILPALACLALVLLPGAALLVWLQPRQGQPAAGVWEMSILAATLSLSLLPLLLLAARLVGLPLGPAAAWSLILISALALAARLAQSPPLRRAVRQALALPHGAADWAWTTAALAVVGLVVFTRVLVVRSMEVPSWGDSVEHTAIVQLLLDQHGLFNSWLPYTPFQSFTVHFGFHTAAAFVAWLSGATAPRAVTLAGQGWNVLAVLAIYPLAARLAGGREGRWAGLAAVLIAGLLSSMPMFYINWGRYPQLASLALLPGAILLLWRAMDAPRWQIGPVLLAAMALAGTFLTYYRFLFFYVIFVGAWGLAHLLPQLRFNIRAWLAAAARLASVAAPAAVLVLPYLLNMSRGYLDEGLAVTAASGASTTLAEVLRDYHVWYQVTEYNLPWVLALSAVALLWSLARRRWLVAALGLWTVGVAAVEAAALIGLPGTGLMSHFAVMISLYLPTSILTGWLLATLAGRLVERRAAWALAVLIVAAGLWGARDRLLTIDNNFVLVTRPDELAMKWIAANTPPDSIFMVNGFTIYDGGSAVGSDAGWWIPLLAGRQNTMPPQYALLSEQEIEPGYEDAVVDLVRYWESTPLPAQEGWGAACALGVTHIYLGQLQGQVGIPPPHPLFTPSDLLASPAVKLIYHQDRVWIFALAEDTCPD